MRAHYYEKLILQRVCIKCREPLNEGEKHRQCKACRMKVNDRVLELKQKKADMGLCVRCGKQMSEEDRVGGYGKATLRCAECRRKLTDAVKKRRREHMYGYGNCTLCGNRFVIREDVRSAICPDCAEAKRKAAKRRSRAASEEQEERKRIEENIRRYRNGTRERAMVNHPCYSCVYCESIDDGGRLFLPFCGAGCLKEMRLEEA